MIQLEEVTKVFPDGTEAVKDVSFEVKEGQLCVLLGPSGCGKTTTMKMINRLYDITHGTICVNGKDITDTDENELRKGIGFAIQNVGLFPHMTVAENIETVPILNGWSEEKRKDRVRELLDLLQLDPDTFADKYPHELSGGQRQRVGVARALGADPPILLMDEPFGAIDPITRIDLQDEFLKIQEEIQKTIIFVTHDIYEAIRMGDMIALLKEGRLVQYTSPMELLFNPEEQFVADFVGTDPALKGLQLIRAKDVMRKPPSAIQPDHSLESAKKQMEEAETDGLPVVDSDGKFQGWIFKRDLNREGKVEDAMTTTTPTAGRHTVLNQILSQMLTTGIQRVVVLNRKNEVEGVLSFEAIQEELMAWKGEDGES